jgi:hypothetical protein
MAKEVQHPSQHWDDKTQAYVADDPNWKADPNNKPDPKLVEKPVAPVVEPIKVLAVKSAWWRADQGEFLSRYPLTDMAIGDGFFVANVDMLPVVAIDVLHKEVNRVNSYFGVPEYDELGGEVYEDVQVKGKKPDGTLTATIVHRHRMLYARYYAAIAVVKDQEIGDGVKAPADGVLVIREA